MKTNLLIASFTCAVALGATPLVEAAAPAKKPAATSTKIPADQGWPREITKDGVKLVYYQPQIDEWKSYRSLRARIAFSLTPKEGDPAVGVAELEGATTANLEERTVFIRDLKITTARFPSLPDAEEGLMKDLLQRTFPARSMTVSLDRLIAGVERSKEAAKPLELKMDPPKIFASATPAILLIVEGKPVTAPVEGTGLEFVVNTNWDLFFDAAGPAYYLLSDKTWLTAAAVDGEWKLATKLPAGFAKLPKGDQWDHVKKLVPAKVAKGMTVPKVFYSEEPAELIAFNGNPVWEKVADTRLVWAKNTESWLFEQTEEKQVYFLVSGRWFRAANYQGPWTYAGNDLPEDFKLIPTDSPCADVLASVPGTPEAADAVLLAEVPTEAVVKRTEAEAKAKVSYDGDPKFQPIEGSKMGYATNTSSDVIQVENDYYLCQDAVWFVGPAPIGPWRIALKIPDVIYTISPAYPVHRVTYVHVEEGESDDVVVCSYTAGYFGAYVAGVATTAALVWGTGYYYPPFVAWGGRVPIFRPWPTTYGVAAAYNPWTGGYAVGARVYGPYATAGRAAWHNPVTGTYGRAARVSGSYGARTVAAGYNPRTDTGFVTRQGNNGYAQWGTSAVRRGDDWVHGGHIATDDGGAARWRGSDGGGRVWKTDDHGGGVVRHDGNMYAGRDGNVYRKDDDGNWSKYDKGEWNSVDRSDAKNDAREKPQNNDAREKLQNSDARQKTQDAKPRDRPGASDAREKLQNRPETRPPPAARTSIENRPTTRRAESQPSSDVVNRLNRESSDRQRSDFHVDRQQSFQRSGGGGASMGSRSFSGGGGAHLGGGGGARGGGGGGGRRR